MDENLIVLEGGEFNIGSARIPRLIIPKILYTFGTENTVREQ